MKLILVSLMLLLSSCFSVSVAEEVTTIVVVRHAEKLKGRDPGLSRAGKRRAIRLSGKFSNLSGVYSSNFKRTLETAVPSADKFNLRINSSIDPVAHKALKADILKNHPGKTVLVVGHSNTVPGFVNSLFSSERIDHISEGDFSNFFVLKIENGAGVDFKREKY